MLRSRELDERRDKLFEDINPLMATDAKRAGIASVLESMDL